jgi:hypothetical protein
MRSACSTGSNPRAKVTRLLVAGLKFFSKFGPRLLVFPPVLFGFIGGFMKKNGPEVNSLLRP